MKNMRCSRRKAEQRRRQHEDRRKRGEREEGRRRKPTRGRHAACTDERITAHTRLATNKETKKETTVKERRKRGGRRSKEGRKEGQNHERASTQRGRRNKLRVNQEETKPNERIDCASLCKAVLQQRGALIKSVHHEVKFPRKRKQTRKMMSG